VGGEQTFDATCSTDLDCALANYTLDCGGSVVLVGVTESEAGRMEDWNQACWQEGPHCELLAHMDVTEAGLEVENTGPTIRCHQGECTSAPMAPEVGLASAAVGGAWIHGTSVILPSAEGLMAADIASGERQWVRTEPLVPLGVVRGRIYAIGGDPDRLGVRMFSVETGEDLSTCSGGDPDVRFPWQDTIRQTYEHELLTAWGHLYIQSTTHTGPVPRGALMPESEPAAGGTKPQTRTYWLDDSGCVFQVRRVWDDRYGSTGSPGGHSVDTDLWEISRGEGHVTPGGYRESWTVKHRESGQVHTVSEAPSLSPGHTVVAGTVLTTMDHRLFGVALTGEVRWSEPLLHTRYLGPQPPSRPPTGPTSGPPSREP
jgi:hypothetical protein